MEVVVVAVTSHWVCFYHLTKSRTRKKEGNCGLWSLYGRVSLLYRISGLLCPGLTPSSTVEILEESVLLLSKREMQWLDRIFPVLFLLPSLPPSSSTNLV